MSLRSQEASGPSAWVALSPPWFWFLCQLESPGRVRISGLGLHLHADGQLGPVLSSALTSGSGSLSLSVAQSACCCVCLLNTGLAYLFICLSVNLSVSQSCPGTLGPSTCLSLGLQVMLSLKYYVC